VEVGGRREGKEKRDREREREEVRLIFWPVAFFLGRELSWQRPARVERRRSKKSILLDASPSLSSVCFHLERLDPCLSKSAAGREGRFEVHDKNCERETMQKKTSDVAGKKRRRRRRLKEREALAFSLSLSLFGIHHHHH